MNNKKEAIEQQIKDLTAAAEKDLADKPALHKAFILSLHLGLRTSEITTVRWGHIQGKGINVSNARTAKSRYTVPIEPSALKTLKALRSSNSKDDYFILTDQDLTTQQQAICEATYTGLHHWLRDQGIKVRHPIHHLRSLYGMTAVWKFGLADATRALGHTDVKASKEIYDTLMDSQQM